MRCFATLLALGLVAGCAQTPRPTSNRAYGCKLFVYKLRPSLLQDPKDLDTSSHELQNAVGTAVANGSTARGRILVLSGGSLHGAFGAGFFHGWKKSAGSIPNYDVVTGVSTGALQSTYVFLANKALPANPKRFEMTRFLKRRLGVGEIDSYGNERPGRSYLGDLVQDYMPDSEADLLKLRSLAKAGPGSLGLLDVAWHGSMAEMSPLRQIIMSQIDDATLISVAEEAYKGRKLLVGVSDLENGAGYAVDLTELAKHAVEKRTFASDRQCYADALIASSSVPPGVPPVNLYIKRLYENGKPIDPNRSNHGEAAHLFVDGGATYAVFLDQVATLASGKAVDVDVVVNGSFFPDSEFVEKRENRDKADGRVSLKYVFDRSLEVLEGQVRQFSVGQAADWAVQHGRFRFAYISNDVLSGGDSRPSRGDSWQDWHVELDGTNQSCRSWKIHDTRKLHPLQFLPSYMRCVVNYGEHRGANEGIRWNLIKTGR